MRAIQKHPAWGMRLCGVLAALCVVLLIVSGLFLVQGYLPSSRHAIAQVRAMAETPPFVHAMHANGTSVFFFALYGHLLGSIYYRLYRVMHPAAWAFGIVLLALVMATAFMGYVLPWTQMGYWAATVITGLFSAIPWIGDSLMTWVRGGFVVGDATLVRFFVMHCFLPFVILGFIAIHILWVRHARRASHHDPLFQIPQATVHNHATASPHRFRFYGVCAIMGILFYALAVIVADLFESPDRLLPANPMVTPDTITPEWYFLPFYAMVRTVTVDVVLPFTKIVVLDAKLGGALALVGSMAVLALLPWIDPKPKQPHLASSSCEPHGWHARFFTLWVASWIVLAYVGAQSADSPLIVIGQCAAVWYFVYVLIVLPKMR